MNMPYKSVHAVLVLVTLTFVSQPSAFTSLANIKLYTKMATALLLITMVRG